MASGFFRDIWVVARCPEIRWHLIGAYLLRGAYLLLCLPSFAIFLLTWPIGKLLALIEGVNFHLWYYCARPLEDGRKSLLRQAEEVLPEDEIRFRIAQSLGY